jgi:hypothetical protein
VILRYLFSSFGSWVGVDKVSGPRYKESMRGVELRLLLAIVVVLLGATLIVGLNFGEDDDAVALLCQAQPLHVHPDERGRTSLALPTTDRPTSAPRRSSTKSDVTARTGASVIDLVCVRRC